ncbi:hypothetical protein XENOCAPTIV_018233 [Xenoophorus captivus]|uniref:Uncharacterized protein n=1 Tax=Xenoophorus captivus TaxID=1517983 RepID=A0ABV0SFY7_9TELE
MRCYGYWSPVCHTPTVAFPHFALQHIGIPEVRGEWQSRGWMRRARNEMDRSEDYNVCVSRRRAETWGLLRAGKTFSVVTLRMSEMTQSQLQTYQPVTQAWSKWVKTQGGR